MTEAATFTCSICSEPSNDICVSCTKDACWNHRCERCKRCSDCCECDVPLTAREPQMAEPVETPPLEPAPDSSWLTPPEAAEEPDMNIPPAPVIEHSAELEQLEEKSRPFPTNSAQDEHEHAE